MPVKKSAGQLACVCFFSLILCGCFQPPYNHFREDKRALRQTGFGAAFGTAVGAMAGTVAGSAGAGAIVGGVTGAAVGMYKNSKKAIIHELKQQDIEFVQYGDTLTLIVPTDKYFEFNSPRLNDICYPGLINIIRLLKFYPCTPIYVAGFTDDIGSRRHKKMLSQAQAETMLTFLWANNIDAHRLHAEGYADKYAIGDNKLIRGSAYNRRIEIQWLNAAAPQKPLSFMGVTK
ncbi:C-OmpA-like family protein CmpA [Legionella londiniensis]|uniref:Outer membrane protein, OmpA family protein n=1 Tax=Legionella londiniensis TaxID=45068 RepID=A0A0W0VT04_9GAMM|nr:C-OmpA-like family protein CmpA [Legionella londiniensis]KTD23262.1 outer membrane protein, OmpA family protein [Legionella londiniensis]STX93726.1 outer membrane protein, OmpA family protein [Legionella londiniensis]